MTKCWKAEAILIESSDKPIPFEKEATTKLRHAYHKLVGKCPFHCGQQEEENMHYMICSSTTQLLVLCRWQGFLQYQCDCF